MSNRISFIGLLKETVDLFKDSRPNYRSGYRPEFNELLKRELMNLLPKPFGTLNLNRIDAIFLCIIFLESDFCSEAVRHYARFWTESYEESLKLQMQLEKSIETGDLSKFIEKDQRDRLKLKSEARSKIIFLLIPAGFTFSSPAFD
jgi:hypothetical protein